MPAYWTNADDATAEDTRDYTKTQRAQLTDRLLSPRVLYIAMNKHGYYQHIVYEQSQKEKAIH